MNIEPRTNILDINRVVVLGSRGNKVSLRTTLMFYAVYIPFHVEYAIVLPKKKKQKIQTSVIMSGCLEICYVPANPVFLVSVLPYVYLRKVTCHQK